jgi:hypothetical protein
MHYVHDYPRRESNPHLRFRKPPFYPLNYGDGMKGKVRRMKEEVQRSGITVQIPVQGIFRAARISCSNRDQKV